MNNSSSRPDILREMGKSIPGIYVPSLYESTYKPDGMLEAILPMPGTGLPEKVAYRRADLCPISTLQDRRSHSQYRIQRRSSPGDRQGMRQGMPFLRRRDSSIGRYGIMERMSSCKEPPTCPQRAGSAWSAQPYPTIPKYKPCAIRSWRAAGSLSFSSLRADTLTPGIISALESSDHQAVAIAPEAGSERLRRVINKNLTEEQIYRAAEILAAKGILNIKLYFMIGLPTETRDDLQGIVETAGHIRRHILSASRGKTRLGTLTLSVNSFVPKPFTPFQWVPFDGVRNLREKAKWIQRALQKVPNVRVHFDLPKWSYVQALLSRGDRRTSFFLEKVALEGLSWSQAMRDAPFNPDFWVMRKREKDEKFPWEIVDHGISRGFLWDEYQNAVQEKFSPECRPGTDCRRCGVCGP